MASATDVITRVIQPQTSRAPDVEVGQGPRNYSDQHNNNQCCTQQREHVILVLPFQTFVRRSLLLPSLTPPVATSAMFSADPSRENVESTTFK